MTDDQKLPLAPQGVFHTVQGEGLLMGLPMVFVRFAGCPVGCPECDTDYSIAAKKTVKEIVRDIVSVSSTATEWVWLTGGEPTIHDIQPLIQGIHKVGLKVALATAGIRPVPRGNNYTVNKGTAVLNESVDFLSVSPHRIDPNLVQRRGEQVNLVFGLNGLTPEECEPIRAELEDGFPTRWVTPCEGKPDTFNDCLDWVNKYRGWRIGTQVHKQWGLP